MALWTVFACGQFLRQVVRNPPDEQGIREEWQKQTGWHRKEDIYRGLRRPNDNATQRLILTSDANNNIKGSKPQRAINKQPSTLRLSSYSSRTISFLLIMLLVFIIVDRIKRGNKIRKR